MSSAFFKKLRDKFPQKKSRPAAAAGAGSFYADALQIHPLFRHTAGFGRGNRQGNRPLLAQNEPPEEPPKPSLSTVEPPEEESDSLGGGSYTWVRVVWV